MFPTLALNWPPKPDQQFEIERRFSADIIPVALCSQLFGMLLRWSAPVEIFSRGMQLRDGNQAIYVYLMPPKVFISPSIILCFHVRPWSSPLLAWFSSHLAISELLLSHWTG